MAKGAQRLWVKADVPLLKKRHTAAQAIERIFDSCLDHWEQNEGAALVGTDPEGVHQLRIGIRRFRSAIAVFRDLLPKNDLFWVEPGARDILSALNPARDWDVLDTELLAGLRERFPHDDSLTHLDTAVTRARHDAHTLVHTTITSERYSNYVANVRQWNSRRDWQHAADRSTRKKLKRPVVKLARTVLSERHRRVLTLGKGFKRLSTEDRHRVRIAIKKLRYAVEFFSGLYKDKKAKQYLRTLKLLQDDFGKMNDVVVASERLAELAAPGNPTEAMRLGRAVGFVIGWHENVVAVMEPQLVANWQKFAAAKPFWHK